MHWLNYMITELCHTYVILNNNDKKLFILVKHTLINVIKFLINLNQSCIIQIAYFYYILSTLCVNKLCQKRYIHFPVYMRDSLYHFYLVSIHSLTIATNFSFSAPYLLFEYYYLHDLSSISLSIEMRL